MAPRSRSTRASTNRGTSAKASSRQSALTFNNSRVTKPTGAISAKDKKAAVEAEAKAAKLVKQVQSDTEPADEIKQVQPETEEDATENQTSTTNANIPIRTQTQPKEQTTASGPELSARKVSETQIRKYWKGKEAERKTPRVHQEGLSLHEKILREFDMSYQYGPCIGISRTKRWTRAENLGLKPPIEVLAVLLKEDTAQKEKKFERAHMDVLANSRYAVVA